MTFEIGDKVVTNTSLYIERWVEAGLKGKVVGTTNYGAYRVKFKGYKGDRSVLASFLEARAPKSKFQPGDRVEFVKPFYEGMSFEAAEGVPADVMEILPNGYVRVEFDDYSETAAPEEYLALYGSDEDENEEESIESVGLEDDPDVESGSSEIEVLNQILARIEEIKELLTPKEVTVQGATFNITGTVPEALFVTEREEEPAPEPTFKKAKHILSGDSVYTEAGAYDKVNRVETKDSGYTSLYGAFGRIMQVPAGRVLQVMETVE